MVCEHTLYSDNLISNPDKVFNFSVNNVVLKNGNKQKEAVVGPFLKHPLSTNITFLLLKIIFEIKAYRKYLRSRVKYVPLICSLVEGDEHQDLPPDITT